MMPQFGAPGWDDAVVVDNAADYGLVPSGGGELNARMLEGGRKVPDDSVHSMRSDGSRMMPDDSVHSVRSDGVRVRRSRGSRRRHARQGARLAHLRRTASSRTQNGCSGRIVQVLSLRLRLPSLRVP